MSRRMVVLSDAASRSPVLPDQDGTDGLRKTAKIVPFPKQKVVPVADFVRDCAKLILATFPASSLTAICRRAAEETRAGCPSTFRHIVEGDTKRPDAYLMHCVMAAAISKGIHIPASLAIRIANGDA